MITSYSHDYIRNYKGLKKTSVTKIGTLYYQVLNYRIDKTFNIFHCHKVCYKHLK